MLRYQEIITENAEDLRQQLRQAKTSRKRDRLRILYLLKTGKARTIVSASEQIGMTVIHVHRLFKRYQAGGLSAMIESRYGGNRQKLSVAQKQQLIERSASGFSSQQEAQSYIAQEFNQQYTQSGISRLFASLKIKLKTARPSNKGKDKIAGELFKKSIP